MSDVTDALDTLNTNTSKMLAKVLETNRSFETSKTAAQTSAANASASASAASADRVLAQTAKTAAENARNAAQAAAGDAVEVVTGGTASLTPEAGKLPIAGASGRIDADWLSYVAPAMEKLHAQNTAVMDVYVYDTTKDSDGGAWRKRCAHTSWYNEELNTATRGGRREFPSLAVIVATDGTGGRVTIYDGDSPDMPMWMVFLKGNNSPQRRMIGIHINEVIRSVCMKNGLLAVGTRTSTTYGAGLYSVDFLTERRTMHRTAVLDGPYYREGIAGRNAYYTGYGDYAIRDSSKDLLAGQDVVYLAMTVPPGTPVNLERGLPTPTIAAGTLTGVNVILHDGTVVKWTLGHRNSGVSFDTLGRLMMCRYPDAILYVTEPLGFLLPDFPSNSLYYAGHSSSSGSINIFGSRERVVAPSTGSTIVTGTSAGLSLLYNASVLNESLVGTITNRYNTGWMPRYTNFAGMCDGVTGSLTGAELLEDGDFDASTGWTDSSMGTGTAAIAGGVCTLLGSDFDNRGEYFQEIDTVEGNHYVIEADVISWGGLYLRAENVATDGADASRQVTATGIARIGFTASGVLTRIVIRSQDGTSEVESVSVKDAARDYSGRGNHATVTRPVERTLITGSEIVQHATPDTLGDNGKLYTVPISFTPETNVFFWAGWVSLEGAYSTVFQVVRADGEGFNIRQNEGEVVGYRTSAGLGNATVAVATSSILTGGVNGFKYGRGTFLCVSIDRDRRISIYQNGILIGSTILGAPIIGTTEFTELRLLHHWSQANRGISGALMRFANRIPTDDQIRKMYQDEKQMLTGGAFVDGGAESITDVAYDESTDQFHAITSWGRSSFQGLQRIDSEATAVGTPSTVSAAGGVVSVGGSTGASISAPQQNLRAKADRLAGNTTGPREDFEFEGDAVETVFTMPKGWKPQRVYVDGLKQREGSAEAYSVSYDGFQYIVTFAVAPGAGAAIDVEAIGVTP